VGERLEGAVEHVRDKAGFKQLGRALGVELKQHGVTTTVAYFGFVATEMVRMAVEEDELGRRFRELIPRPLQKQITPRRGRRGPGPRGRAAGTPEAGRLARQGVAR